MFQKSTFKSKTFWVGIATVVGGIALIANSEMEKGIGSILAGLAMITGRDAISKVEPK